MLYFAYGSNMSYSQMKDRCPGNHFLQAASLEDYKFVYDRKSSLRGNMAVANIIKKALKRVKAN